MHGERKVMPDTEVSRSPREAVEGHRERRAVLTWLTCALCVGFTLAYHLSYRYAGAGWSWAGRMGVLPLAEVWDGNVRSLFTAVFVHGSPASPLVTALHLGFNLLWLYALGHVLEQTLARWQWALFFVAAGVIASGAEIAVSSKPSVGVSGIIYAMFGLMWAGRREVPRWRAVATRGIMVQLLGWGLFFVVASVFLGWHVANAAHGGGFLFGLACGWFFVAKRRRLLAGAILALLLALTVLSVTWMPWSGEWTAWRGDREFRRGEYEAAIGWYRRSLALGHTPALLRARIYAARLAQFRAAWEARGYSLQVRPFFSPPLRR